MSPLLTLVGGRADSVVEIAGPDSAPRQVDVPAGLSVPVTLEPGPYTCRAVYPDASVRRWSLHLTGGGARIELDASYGHPVPAPPPPAGPLRPVVPVATSRLRVEEEPDLEDLVGAGSVAPGSDILGGDLLGSVLLSSVLTSPGPRRATADGPPSPLAGLWAALWTWEGRWRPTPWPGEPAPPDGAAVTIALPVPSGAMHAVQVGGLDVPARVVVLPPSTLPSITLRRVASGGLHGGLRVEVHSGNDRADRLLTYSAGGLLEQAVAVSGWVDDAESLLRGKVGDPTGAAVGGYHLLHTGQPDRMHSWAATFARLYPWLPDAAALATGRALAVVRPLPRAELAELLRAAVAAGPPAYTHGLRIVYDALLLLGGDGKAAGPAPDLLERTRPLAAAVDWDVPWTTYRATDPNRPVLRARTGPRPARMRQAVQLG